MMPALRQQWVVADRPVPTEYFIENDRRQQGDSTERKLLKIKEIRIVWQGGFLYRSSSMKRGRKTLDIGSRIGGRIT
jgi:hypothetical protein